MAGIIAYGAYVPYFRLQRAAIGEALGTLAAPGERAVAAYDEDATSMGVEAARVALRGRDPSVEIRDACFATSVPPYLDKTNCTAIHAALDLSDSAAAYDMVGSVRSGAGALRSGLESARPSLVVLSDVRTGRAGGADEIGGGDAAAAFVCGEGTTSAPAVAELICWASATDEFLDRWREPGVDHSEGWEERFAEHAYAPLGEQAFTDALKAGGVGPDAVDRLIVTGPQPRAVRQFLKRSGVKPEAIVDDLSATVGCSGTAHVGVLLASTLDVAEPDELIAVVVLADGADAALFRATEAIEGRRSNPTVASQIDSGCNDLSYASFLTWRGALVREPARRPDPVQPAAPPALRSEGWKFAFIGSRCSECGARNLPPSRVCVNCRAVDAMEEEPLADVEATVRTFTLDRLAPSLNPPVVAAVLDFDGGGRYQCELTDVDAGAVTIGDRVEMTFRRVSTVDGVHNYFWKARPKREQ